MVIPAKNNVTVIKQLMIGCKATIFELDEVDPIPGGLSAPKSKPGLLEFSTDGGLTNLQDMKLSRQNQVFLSVLGKKILAYNNTRVDFLP